MNTYCLATIVNHEEITSGIWKMELAASEIARTAEPGQFIQLYPPDKRNLLARPISLSAISEKSVTIVYRIAGKGTKQFSQLQKNDRIRIMGPLGNGFVLPDQATKSIVVGGGLGIPPLLELSKRLGGNTEVCLVIRTYHLWQRIFIDWVSMSILQASREIMACMERCVIYWKSLILQQDRYLLADQDRCLSLCQHGQKNTVSRFKFLWKNGRHVALVPV